jgi:hypothetical protein
MNPIVASSKGTREQHEMQFNSPKGRIDLEAPKHHSNRKISNYSCLDLKPARRGHRGSDREPTIGNCWELTTVCFSCRPLAGRDALAPLRPTSDPCRMCVETRRCRIETFRFARQRQEAPNASLQNTRQIPAESVAIQAFSCSSVS